MTLIIKDLHVRIDDTEILKGLNLTIKPGEVVALMGPNGSGKSTLSHVIMGHPSYTVTKGSITYHGEDVLAMSPEERSHKGLFLSFQHPPEVPGLLVKDYLLEIYKAKTGSKPKIMEFRRMLKDALNKLRIDESFTQRYLNQGFSGGEKKRMEMLQMALLKPTMAVLDETDSGLDIDALKNISQGIQVLRAEDKELAVLIITHYKRILEHVKPDRVVVLMNGKIIKEGNADLVHELETQGYEWAQQDVQ
jgi:Fe-S cluster assembly ATP-binding protein